jgi:hypothetical protein
VAQKAQILGQLNYHIDMYSGDNEGKLLMLKQRLASFDRATDRQRKRNLLAANAGAVSRVGGRGWTRYELYARGYSRTPDCKSERARSLAPHFCNPTSYFWPSPLLHP